MSQDVVSWSVFPVSLKRMCNLCCWLMWSMDVHYIHNMIDSGVEFSNVLTSTLFLF